MLVVIRKQLLLHGNQQNQAINIDSLPVQYYSQSMTSEMLESIVSMFHRRIRLHGRSIALLMDNVGCHPEEQLKVTLGSYYNMQVATT